jgi:hypothetical protein
MMYATVSVSAEKVIAMAHFATAPHVAVIGHRTLPFVLALMDCGCTCVRSLRPDVAAPDCEAADLAWIVDVADGNELGDALRAARRRTGDRGKVVVEGVICQSCGTLLQHVANADLDVISFDHLSQRVVLAARSRLAIAA